jgi:signal transduction histidine kinase
MTIARQFYLLVCLPPLLAIAFGASLTYQFSKLSTQGANLISALQRTERISRKLASGNAEAGRLLSAQFQSPDPAFPDRMRAIDYELGEQSTEYLRLDIGVQERLVVERIKALLGELTVVGLQVHRHLRAGADRAAARDLNRAHQIEGDLHDEFQELSGLQLATLHTVLGHVDFATRQGLYAVVALIAAMFLAAAATTVITRRRIIQPVRSVLDASERIRVGDLAARAPEARSDEIGRLTHGFNFMAESLARSYADLERKVADRTARLEEVQGQLVQAEKLSAIGQLVGGVAHELNNPLAAIMGFTELAKVEAAARPEAAPVLHLLDQVDAHVERSRRIVGNLLQFARRQAPRVEAFEINAAVEQMLELRAYQLVTRNTQIVRAYDPSNPVIYADRDKVQQVVLNLLNNAHDAIAETGRPGTVTVTTRAENESIVIQFADDGPGFREPARAFDPFYTTKEVGKGTGLGLSVCYGIVKEHGGEITAANLDRGAIVTIRLPIGDPAAVAAAQDAERCAGPEPAVSAAGARHKVLVVDDEPALVRLQLTFLARMGLEGHGVESGEEAIRYLEEHHVDAVVSDVRMPGSVDGIKVYEWAVANRPAVASRFLFVSGDLIGLNLDAFFERNRVPRVSKPFRYEAYSRAVLEAVSDAGRDAPPETGPERGSTP